MFSRRVLASCQKGKQAPWLSTSRSLVSATNTTSPSASSSLPFPAVKDTTPKAIISTAVILNRSPMITRTPTPFEQSYYAYHSRIQRALHNPFPYEFYFKQGSLLEKKFMNEEREREREAFGGPRRGKKKGGVPAAANALESNSGRQEEKSMPRTHEADKKNDVRSLDRQMQRNIYLLVRGRGRIGEHQWRFPEGGLQESELLHEAAERELFNECGHEMDTWIVSRNPIGVYQPEPSTVSADLAQAYTFFYKAHIMAGQVKPNGKTIDDFAWLTKEEIAPRVDKSYWSGIKDILSDF